MGCHRRGSLGTGNQRRVNAVTPVAIEGVTIPTAGEGGEPTLAPTHHIGRWIAAIVVVLVGAAAIASMATNSRFEWTVVWQYFTYKSILLGLGTTIVLTVIAMTVGIVCGTLIAVMRISTNPVLRTASSMYVWFFRGVPPLVLLIFVYNIAALYPRLIIPSPVGGHPLVSTSMNALITSFTAAIIGLGLNETAYMSEIIRAGILSIPDGQVHAALALGMTRRQAMRIVVLPQAMKVIIPPTGNETIGMLKLTSLVSVIALADLLYSTELIYSENFQTIPLLIVATIWYLVATTLLTILQQYVEHRFGKKTGGTPGAMGGLARRTLRSVMPYRSGSVHREGGNA